jgi:signal transduction histidine kinase/ActR/RegA family two-component response regulator
MSTLQPTGVQSDAWRAERGTNGASRARAVLAGAPVALFAIDSRGVLTVSDGQGLAALGCCATELVGRSAFELYAGLQLHRPGGEVITGAEAVRRALAGEAIDGECTIGERSFDFRLQPQRDATSGAVRGVVGAAVDVTERNEARERLLVADRLAAIGTLAAGAAHEINNPLTYAGISVDHVARVLRMTAARGLRIEGDGNDDLTPGLIEALGRASHGLQRVRDIVRSLLTFSHGDVETRRLVDLHGVVESSIQMAMHEVIPRAHLVRELGDAPPVEANEARLGQVFLNLLVNAAHAIPDENPAAHEVRIAMWTDEQARAVVEVSDTGVGIPPHVLPRIFDPFFTLNATGEAKGLGLSVSLGTVKSLGGDIEVESRPGRGSTFRVLLPHAPGWRASRPPASARSVPEEKPRMLVLDDDALVGEAIARCVQAEADVEVLSDTREVLVRLAAGTRWDLVLCDLMMPGLSGMDLYREVLARAPDAAGSIVFMTGGAFTPRARAFVASVGKRCVEKPIDADALREIVRSCGRARHAH